MVIWLGNPSKLTQHFSFFSTVELKVQGTHREYIIIIPFIIFPKEPNNTQLLFALIPVLCLEIGLFRHVMFLGLRIQGYTMEEF